MLVGCDYTNGLWECGVAQAKELLLKESVKNGGLLKGMWDVKTADSPTRWLDQLRDVLPVKKKGEADVFTCTQCTTSRSKVVT